jgi:hypothetical protein
LKAKARSLRAAARFTVPPRQPERIRRRFFHFFAGESASEYSHAVGAAGSALSIHPVDFLALDSALLTRVRT